MNCYHEAKRQPHHLDCFVMGLKDSSPPEFVKIVHESYNIHVVTKEGASYYESYHNEQLRDFFTLEHHLRQQELPSKVPTGFEDFRIAFDREAKRKNLSGVSFAQITYDGVEPSSILWTPGSRSPTVQEVLGVGVDLRSQSEKLGIRVMTEEEDVVLCQMAIRQMGEMLRMDRYKRKAFEEREDRHQQKGVRLPDAYSRRTTGTEAKPRRRRRSSSSPPPRHNHRRSPESSNPPFEDPVAGPSTVPRSEESEDVHMRDEGRSPLEGNGISIKGQATKGDKKGKGRAD